MIDDPVKLLMIIQNMSKDINNLKSALNFAINTGKPKCDHKSWCNCVVEWEKTISKISNGEISTNMIEKYKDLNEKS